MDRKMWLFKSYSDEHDLKAIKKVLERGTWWVKGPEIEEFEKRIADLANRKHGIAFNSGTSALYTDLLAHGITEGEVIVPSFTFAATANAVVAAGAEPVFADIEADSLGLDPEDVRKKITSRTRAIIPIHFAGDICKEIETLKELADENEIPLIEDAAHSIGAKLGEKPVGSFGNSAEFSFCFNKILTTGEGGMIVTDSEEHMRQLKLIRSHGRNEQKEYITFGFNFRMSSMTAALGLSQFEKLDFIISKRREMAEYLNQSLAEVKGLQLPVFPDNRYSVFQLYNIRLKDEQSRDNLKKYLEDQGIPTRITYNPIHLTKYYRENYGYGEGSLPVTENISRKILTLPFHLDLDQEDLAYLIQAIKKFFQNET